MMHCPGEQQKVEENTLSHKPNCVIPIQGGALSDAAGQLSLRLRACSVWVFFFFSFFLFFLCNTPHRRQTETTKNLTNPSLEPSRIWTQISVCAQTLKGLSGCL